jgi:hypothetical protein
MSPREYERQVDDLVLKRQIALGGDKEFIENIRERQRIADDLRKLGRRPNATGPAAGPYVTSTEGWTDLALKRVLKEAAEGGYDKVVWTPGAEQAKRYDLSKQINSIDYMREGDDAYRLGITNKHGEGIDLPKDTFTAKELEDYLGKEVAQKIVEDEGKAYRGRNHKTLEGLDLEVGGEGMKGYYDNIVPKRLQDIARRHDKGAKVGMVEGVLPDDIAAPGIDITPQMRESILRGQPHMADGGAVLHRGRDRQADAGHQKGQASLASLLKLAAEHGLHRPQVAHALRQNNPSLTPEAATSMAKSILSGERSGLQEILSDKLMKDLRRALRDHHVRGRS